MIELLKKIEQEQLMDLLDNPEVWKGLIVDYHKPTVYRCWTQLGEHRLSLHIIDGCEEGESLYHPHPWPSAMRVVSGSGPYEMGVGFGPGLEPPPIACRLILSPGDYYEMLDINGWHYVRPLGTFSASLMLSGKPWDREQIEAPGDSFTKELPELSKLEILRKFKEDWYSKK
jgi:hypothetical protein